MTTQESASRRLNLNLDRLDILVLGVLIGLFAGAVIASLYFHFRTALPDLADWLDSVLQNTGTEMFGAFLTFLLIEVMLRKRREGDVERQAIEREKERLVLQLGSPDHGFAVEAARILRARGWGFWQDETLQNAHLVEANLQGAGLTGANLREAELLMANLQGASLWDASLQGANLDLANLQEAILFGANLRGTNLRWVNLQEATLEGAEFDESTILPDFTHWSPDTDMARFTDPSHPDFWRSDNPNSPAYRYKDDDQEDTP